jgi:hypothetical protein
MDPNDRAPMTLIRELLDCLDSRAEDALAAHGFAFSALSADEDGAEMRFDRSEGGAWRMTLRLPRPGRPELQLHRGDGGDPDIMLRLRIDGMGRALGVGMGLIAAIDEA